MENKYFALNMMDNIVLNLNGRILRRREQYFINNILLSKFMNNILHLCNLPYTYCTTNRE
jgi:hypothetical protein